jgi:hypothetical protein
VCVRERKREKAREGERERCVKFSVYHISKRIFLEKE